MRKKKELVWNAFYFDFSTGKLETFNVIRDDMIEDVKKAKKKGKDIKEAVKSNLMWHYWSKCEWEYTIQDLWGKKEYKKDVWFQLEMNLDRITEYIERELFNE